MVPTMKVSKYNWLPLALVTFYIPICILALGIHRDLRSIKPSYDYIIAGGGLTGLVVANRLVEDRKTTVLVVEYGDFDDSWVSAIPYYANVPRAFTDLIFTPQSTPQPNLGGRTFNVSHGLTVGGGSTVNGMAIVRGEAADYNLWYELGNDGWGWSGMLPYFKKSSTLNSPSDPKVKKYNYTMSPDGFGKGPYQASWPAWQWPDTANTTSAWINDLGFKIRPEGGLNGKTTGIVWKPLGVDGKNFTRCSSRKAYYDPASRKENLDILVTAFVSKINFSNKTATSVEVIGSDNSSVTGNITATKEVILAAGAIHTPQILQLSGIGPAILLKELGIPVIQDLPGVGANLQDRSRVGGWRYRFNNSNPINPATLQLSNTSSPFYTSSMAEYMTNRTGPLTIAHGNNLLGATLRDLVSSQSEVNAILKDLYSLSPEDYAPPFYFTTNPPSDPSDPDSPPTSDPIPLIEGLKVQSLLLNKLIASPTSMFEIAWGSGDPRMGLTNLKSFSRGTVHINTTSPHPRLNPPVVDYNAFSHPFDINLALLGFKLARRLINSETMKKTLQPVEIYPGKEVQSDEDLLKLLREELIDAGTANQCGTAAMMPEGLGGVVDSELKVYGIGNVRIVDASVLPVGPAGHLQSTMYAVAEKAADLIKGVRRG